MDKQQIFNKVAEILEDQMAINKAIVTEDMSLIDDLGCDSLDLVEIEMAIENDFGIDIFEEEAININTVGDIIDYLEEAL